MGTDKLDRIELKLDDLSEHLTSIDKTLSAQQIILDMHIKRTELLEETVEPIKNHITQLKGVIKFIYLIAGLAGILECWRVFK